MRIKKGFTLAEIMIVLTVIAVISAILIPAARQATPNENVMKFKKAHNTLLTAIRELVNSDKYYLNGDLSIKVDGTIIDGTHSDDNTYFCNTLADILNSKKTTCLPDSGENVGVVEILNIAPNECNEEEILNKIHLEKERIDSHCKQHSSTRKSKILLQNNVVFFELLSQKPFGYTRYKNNVLINMLTGGFKDCNGFISSYKPFCIDIDGIPENATADDCVNECPFGYGIRIDGKILNGARADEWLEKSIQDKDE